MELWGEDGRQYGPFPLGGELDPLLVTRESWLPAKLQPANLVGPPEYCAADLALFFEQGYQRLGAGIMLVDEEANIVMARHKPSVKNPHPVDSIPSETAHFWVDEEDGLVVESALQTAGRCLSEELGVTQGDLLLPIVRSWTMTHWPIGSAKGVPQEKIIAPVIVFGFEEDGEVGEALRGFRGSEEIESVYRQDPVEILNYSEDAIRNGLVGALATIIMQDVLLSLRGVYSLLRDIDLLQRPGFAARLSVQDLLSSAETTKSVQDINANNEALRSLLT